MNLNREIVYRAAHIIKLLHERKSFTIEEFSGNKPPIALNFQYDSFRKIYIINRLSSTDYEHIASLNILGTFSYFVTNIMTKQVFSIVNPKMSLPIDSFFILKIARLIKSGELLDKGYDFIKQD